MSLISQASHRRRRRTNKIRCLNTDRKLGKMNVNVQNGIVYLAKTPTANSPTVLCARQ